MNRPVSGKMPWFKSMPPVWTAIALLVGLSGCQQDVVHQRSMAELNQKAQAMMNAGDYNGAVSRLEAAHDLEPDEVNTLHNLAVAYQMQGNYDKAVELFLQLKDKPGMDRAETLKSLGIAYEGKADKLAADAQALEGNPKEAARKETLTQQSTEALTAARESYQQALAAGLNPPDEVQKQIEALDAKLKRQGEGGPQ